MISIRRLLPCCICWFLFISISCKKDEEKNTNQLRATITFTNGDIQTFKADGSDVSFGCSFFSGGTFVSAKSGSKSKIFFSSFPPSSGLQTCIQSPGNFNYTFCEYNKDESDPNSNVYTEVSSLLNRVTYTSIGTGYFEGHFYAICKSSLGDSVVLSGSFKGR